jgi:hypothetical protein
VDPSLAMRPPTATNLPWHRLLGNYGVHIVDLQGSRGQVVIVLTILPIALPLIAPLSGSFIAALTSCRLLVRCRNVKRSQRFYHQQAHHTYHPSARNPKRQSGNAMPPCEQDIPMSQRLLRGDRHNLQFLSTMQHLLLASCISSATHHIRTILWSSCSSNARLSTMGHRIAARCGGRVSQKHISGRKCPVTANTSKKSLTTLTSSSARAATKHLMSVKQSHTALQPKSLKSGLTAS